MPRDFLSNFESSQDLQNYMNTLRIKLEQERERTRLERERLEREDWEMAQRLQNEINNYNIVQSIQANFIPNNNYIHNYNYENESDSDEDNSNFDHFNNWYNERINGNMENEIRAWSPFFRMLGNPNPRRNRRQNAEAMTYDELSELQERIGFVTKGLKQNELKKITSVKYSTITLKDGEEKNCTICMSDYSPDDDVVEFTICKHVYHKECITKWLVENKTCPICRTEFGI